MHFFGKTRQIVYPTNPATEKEELMLLSKHYCMLTPRAGHCGREISRTRQHPATEKEELMS
jgi:hypothetical protein